MSTFFRINWQGKLSKKEAEILNEALNIKGMQCAAEKGLIPQEEVDKWMARFERKHKER